MGPETPRPANPLVIRSREELLFLLSEAATLEHMIMCQYLFVSFSLKRSTHEGVTPEQLEAILRWDGTIVGVAEQEMLHLSLANNLLTSLGAAPYFGRPNFPLRSRYFPSRVRMSLLPLDEVTLRFFLYLERPETMAIEDVPGFADEHLEVSPDAVVPVGQEFATVGVLYRGIEAGLATLAETVGEERLFLGATAAQATEAYFGWPELVAVRDLASATRAIETIVTEGEGARGDWRNSHFGRFLAIFNEYQELRRADPAFEPSRPVVAAYVRPPANAEERVELIDDRFTAEVSDLFNGSYQVLLQMLGRFFLQVETTEEELQTLSATSVTTMLAVIKPLGEFLTTLPLGPHRPGLTTGPVFEMYPMSTFLPRSRAAWTILDERLLELCARSSELGRTHADAQPLLDVADALHGLAQAYEDLSPRGR